MGVPIPQPASASVDSASGAQVIDGSLKFVAGDSNYLSKTFTLGDRTKWTLSVWVKRNALADTISDQTIFEANGDNNDDDFMQIKFRNSTVTNSFNITGWNTNFVITETQFRDISSWYNLVVSVDTSAASADRLKFYINGERTTRFQTTNTISGDTGPNGAVAHNIGYSAGNSGQAADMNMSQYYFIDGQQLDASYFGFTDPLTGTWKPKKYTNTTATTLATTEGPTLSNGALIIKADDASIAGTIKSNGGNLNFYYSSDGISWTRPGSGGSYTFSAYKYLAAGGSGTSTRTFVPSPNEGYSYHVWNDNTNFDQGSGHTTDVTGKTFIAAGESNFGTNGFYLPMDNQNDFEKDKSGRGNDWTKNNFSGTETDPDVLKDSPSGAAFSGAPTSGITTTSSAPSNYCTWNPLNRTSTDITVSEGNLKAQLSSTGHVMITGTMTMPKGSGKYYWEIVTAGWNTSNQGPMIGVVGDTHKIADQAGGSPSMLFRAAGEWYLNGSETSTGHSTFTTNDVIGVALDLDRNIITWYKNDSQLFQYTSVSSSVNSWIPAWKDSDSGGNAVANWGQKPFKYAPPEGFKTLSSAGSKTETVISDPGIYVGVTTYQGVAGGRQQDDTLSFTPDLVWVKNRSTGEDSKIYDTVRGKSGDNFVNIESNKTSTSQGESGAIQEMLPGGFYATGGGHVNSAGVPFVAYMWRAGGGNTLGSSGDEFWVDDKNYASAAAAGLDDGTITPSAASVGTKQGFSIIQWAGVDNASPSTISHGLTNQTPRFIIVKNLTDAENWAVYHASAGATKYANLNGNSAYSASSAYWNDTAPTTTLITLNNSAQVQRVSRNYVLYAWADVPGLQKFGQYNTNGDGSGGGDEDGPYVQLGFRPAMILLKGNSYTSDWTWIDDRRCRVNYNDVAYRANYQYGDLGNSRGGVGSSSQPQNYAVDLLSNGFKIRSSGGSTNSGTTNTVTYAAWARSPFSDLYGGGANAR